MFIETELQFYYARDYLLSGPIHSLDSHKVLHTKSHTHMQTADACRPVARIMRRCLRTCTLLSPKS